jgi:hypothetical protein
MKNLINGIKHPPLPLPKGWVLHTFMMIILAVAVTGCKTTTYVPVVEHHTDTLRVVQHHRDSIYLHDSTFVREYIQGDTVRVVTEMWHTKYRDRLKTDTIYRSRTDSVPVPYPVVKEVKKPLTMIEKGLMGTGIAALTAILIFFFIHFKKLFSRFIRFTKLFP